MRVGGGLLRRGKRGLSLISAYPNTRAEECIQQAWTSVGSQGLPAGRAENEGVDSIRPHVTSLYRPNGWCKALLWGLRGALTLPRRRQRLE